MNTDKQNIERMRREYTQHGLSEAEALANPVDQFERWLNDALAVHLVDATAMTLSTATRDGKPSLRIVLLKSFDPAGFVFFTNFESRKGREIVENPYGTVLFYWSALERQVKIEGWIEKISAYESQSYFQSRPFESQIGALASPQSRIIPDRQTLEKKFAQLAEQYQGQEVPCPPHWGGYRLQPALFEFWQGRAHRLHDRLQYTKEGDAWMTQRLAP